MSPFRLKIFTKEMNEWDFGQITKQNRVVDKYNNYSSLSLLKCHLKHICFPVCEEHRPPLNELEDVMLNEEPALMVAR